MLTQRHRIAIRRHLGVPFAGTGQAGRLFGWRFAIHNEDLEYKMNNMAPSEEQLITGISLGSYRIDGAPTAGDVLTYTITDPTAGAITASYTVTANDLSRTANPVNPSAAAPSYSIALNSALAINAAAAQYGYGAVGVMPADLFSPQYAPPYFAEIIVMGPSSATFTLAVSRTGTTNATVHDQGTQCPVAATIKNPATGLPQVYYGYTALLDVLAMGMSRADLSLRLTKAEVGFRMDEVAARRKLYTEYCTMLSRDMGGREYVKHFGGGSSAGATA